MLGAADGTEVLVLEMGMRGFGEIARLCAVAPPKIGIVTAVAAAHTARLGGIDGVARAKAELVVALPADGVAILNADDERVAAMARLTRGADDHVRRVDRRRRRVDEVDARRAGPTDVPPAHAVGERRRRSSRASGRHMVGNAAAAIAAAGALGVDVAAAAAARRRGRAVGEPDGGPSAAVGRRRDRRRVQRQPDVDGRRPRCPGGDAGRAAASPSLGVMAELDDPAAAHRAVADRAAERGIELIAVGTDLYGVEPCADPVAAVGPLDQGTAVLVKASRVAGLDRVAAAARLAPTSGRAGRRGPLP